MLEESGISNFQADIAVNQGRTMMVFTIVTIVFVSISRFPKVLRNVALTRLA